LKFGIVVTLMLYTYDKKGFSKIPPLGGGLNTNFVLFCDGDGDEDNDMNGDGYCVCFVAISALSE